MRRSPHWATLKNPNELKAVARLCNRWNMVYRRVGGGWHCMACKRDYSKAQARDHVCRWESEWRTWSGRPVPGGQVKEERRESSLLGQVMSWFKG